MRDLPALLASMRVEGASHWRQRAAAVAAFSSFVGGALRAEYLGARRGFYETQYENVVLCGTTRAGQGSGVPFFFVAGVHEQGFPWGDGEMFWDVMLAVGDGAGSWQSFGMTDRVLEGLEVEIAGGRCRYEGPLVTTPGGCAASFSEIRSSAPHLARSDAQLEVTFQSRRYDAVSFPFPRVDPLIRKLSAQLKEQLRELLPGEKLLGISITHYVLDAVEARFRLRLPGREEMVWEADPAQSAGEGEHGTFRNLKEPTLLYGYFCGVNPAKKAARIQVQSRTLRNERTDWAKDRVDAFLGTIISRDCSVEIRLKDGKTEVLALAQTGKPGEYAPPWRKLGAPLVELRNDQFPTAVFLRRVTMVEDATGERFLALEEDMDLLRREPTNCDRECVVASFAGDDHLATLDSVLEATGFFDLLEQRLKGSGKRCEDFLIAIKPNFMFAYDKRDRTTYTDPRLVGRLAARLRERGFRQIKVVEAQSTYGEYFDKRTVKEMAAYLGYDGVEGYEVVDMTLDAREIMNLGEHAGLHPVSEVWRAADFRISFCKNKTHSYSYYTLTLKNVYGALPKANKFKEYHCGPGIYYPAMEYLRAFPLNYCLIDAWISADGPFGIFADPAPNLTRTIIGGADPVAVDWVGATKMGIHPLVSRYMQIAVEWFGKPRIRLVGDAAPYRPWLNVPAVLTLFTHKGMDADYHFGNLLYSVAAQMDETHFTHKSKAWHIRLLRRLTVPLRQTFFIRTGEKPTVMNRWMSRLLYHLGY